MGLFPKKEIPLPKELLDWVGTAVREGYSVDEIHAHLEKAGYSPKDIGRALESPVARETLPAELMEWLTDALKEGYTPEEVRAHLEKAGYSGEQVRHALSHAEIRRAAAVWTGRDSVPRRGFPLWAVPLAAALILALAGSVALFGSMPEKAMLSPSALVPSGSGDNPALVLSPGENVSIILGFRPGRPHSLAVAASSPAVARLVLLIDGGEAASAVVSGAEAMPYILTFVPSQESGTATLSAEGEIALSSVEFRRPRDVAGSLGI